MMIKTLSSTLAAVALLAAATASAAPAPTNPAAALSLARTTRAAAPVKGTQKAVEKSTLINVGILAALVAGVLVATTTGGNNSDSN